MAGLIPLSAPDITEADIQAVSHALDSGRLSLGPEVEEFERLVARRINRPHAVAVNSGASALFLALHGLDIGPGDEVITPAFSFVATANCILQAGATPVFVDCDPRSLNVRAQDVEKLITDKTKAIIGVHVFGSPSGILELSRLANQYEIELVENASEGLGGRHGKDPIGRIGRVSVFSFYPNHVITTGEGGMIATHDDKLADLCRSLRNQGRAPIDKKTAAGMIGRDESELASGLGFGSGAAMGTWNRHQRLGFSLRMSELNAALGASQVRRLDAILEARQRVAEAYTRRLLGHPHLILPTVEPEVFMSWFVYVVRLSDQFYQTDRDIILAGLRRHDVGAVSYYPPIPQLPLYRSRFGYKAGDFPVAESVSHRTIALPFYTRLTEKEVDLVCQTLELMIKRQTFARGE